MKKSQLKEKDSRINHSRKNVSSELSIIDMSIKRVTLALILIQKIFNMSQTNNPERYMFISFFTPL